MGQFVGRPEVGDLEASLQPRIPELSVTLRWSVTKQSREDEITAYDIRFRPKDADGYINGTSVDGTSKTLTLTSTSGIAPLTTYDFEVRARCGDAVGKWKSVNASVPGPVQNIKAIVDPKQASIRLNWEPPINLRMPGGDTKYRIRFKPTEGRSNYCEKVVATNYVSLTRNSGLEASKMHRFEVRAENAEASGDWKIYSAYIDLVPDPVQSLSAAVNKDIPSVTLSWMRPGNVQVVEELTEHHIRFKPFGDEEYVEKTVANSATSVVLTRESGLVPLKNYHFQVRAQSGYCKGEWKEVTSLYALKPGKVQNLRSTLNPHEASLTLNWDQPNNISTAGDVTAYDIRFKISGGGGGNSYYSIMTVNVPARSIRLTRESGLKPLTKYALEVRARNFHCQGEWSCLSDYIALHPDPVRNLSVTVDENVTLSWNPPVNIKTADELSEYQIRFKPEGSGRYHEMTVKDSCTASIDFTHESGLLPSKNYNFEVRARNDSGEGTWVKASAICALAPGQVQNLRSTLDPDTPTLTLKWDKPKNMVADGDVKLYDIRFKLCGKEGSYCTKTVVPPATSIILRRESGLKALTKYTFEVRAQSVSREGKWSELSKYIALHPDPVRNLSVTVDESVTLSWNPPVNIQTAEELSEYQIRFKPDGNGRYHEMTVKDSCTASIESGLVSSKKYNFEIRPRNDCGEGEWVKASAFCALTPGYVQNLRSTLDTSLPTLTLNWDMPENMVNVTDGDVSYDIRFKPTRSGWEGNYCKKTVKPPATSILLTWESGLKPLTKYDFEIRARSLYREGNWTRYSKYIPLVPGVVQNLRSVPDTSGPSLTLNWDRPNNTQTTTDVGTYIIRFRPSGCIREDSYCNMTVKAPTTSILITTQDGLKPLTKYDFEVRAQNENHEGEWSSVSEYIELVPGKVQNLRSTLDTNRPSLTLAWDKPINVKTAEDVAAYDIRFKPARSWLMRGYHKMTVDSPATSVLLTRENGLNPLKAYDFEVRARSADDCEGEWSSISERLKGNSHSAQDAVHNLTAAVDTHEPSVTLNWDPPANTAHVGDITKYEIHFRDNDSSFHGEKVVNGSTTTTIITRESGLRPLTRFTFKVRAYNHDDVGGEWRTASTFVALVPGQVQNLRSTMDTNIPSLTLTWDKPSNVKAAKDVTAYDIRFRPAGSWWRKDYHKMTVDSPATSVLLTRENGLNPLTTYDFEVRARNTGHNEGEWRKVSEYIALTPGPIHNLKSAVNTHKPSVTLKWDPPANAAYPGSVTKYQIRFLDNEKVCYGMKVVNGCTTETVIAGVPESSGTLSSLEVTAYSGNNESQECRSVSNLHFAALVPDQVGNLAASLNPNVPSVTLTWDPPSNVGAGTQCSWPDVTQYHVRFEPRGGNNVEICCSATSIVLDKDSGLIPPTTSRFEVRAQCGDCFGQWDAVSSYFALTPDPVQNLAVAVDARKPSVTLNWDPPANAADAGDITKYEIHFRDNDRSFHGEKVVNGSITTTIITRESGLRLGTTFTFKVRAYSGDYASQEWRTVSKFIALTPDPVQNLTATVDAHNPSVTLNWDPPANSVHAGDITVYEIHFQDNNDSSFHGEKVVNGSTTTAVITGLRPLTTFTFNVRAYSGDCASLEWRTVSTFVDLVPGPVQNLRLSLDTDKHCLKLNWDRPSNANTYGVVTAYDVRFRPSRSALGNHYSTMTVIAPTTSILLKEESGFQPLTMYDLEVRARNDRHKGRWSKVNFTGVVKIDSRTLEYTDLCEKFRKCWARRKGRCPSIISIAKIINPVISERFESYRHTLPQSFQGVEQHYHGTRLCCDLANSAEPCENPNCGACGIARKGFDPQRISRSSFQRFGNGFYFAPNSSKAHDYAIGKRFGAVVIEGNTRYSSVLLCDIAPGSKYSLQFRGPSYPPPGYHSLYGGSGGELNYDELVVFDHRAIHPRYIFFCQN